MMLTGGFAPGPPPISPSGGWRRPLTSPNSMPGSGPFSGPLRKMFTDGRRRENGMRMIKEPEARSLSLRRRIAWGSGVVERALRGYSYHARVRYLHPQVLDSCWAFVESGRYDPETLAGLKATIVEIYLRENNQHNLVYGEEFGRLGLALLTKVQEDTGPLVCGVV